MITTEKINDIFDKYTAMGNEADLVLDRNMNVLMMFAIDSDHMDINGDRLTFVNGEGPLSSVKIERIAGAEDLGSHMAIIMPASIIFVNKADGSVNVFLAE
ncbi:MAG: hypothetical protein K2O38_00420 [Muribaculaceae bacterium]|nr:hypothetical protein [Muribaculaceae bacterium]MDE7110347.1 hypothetical protein [Muribaculaceae bacterium]